LDRILLQQPNQTAGVGGRSDMIETIARAGIVGNVDSLFMKLILILQMQKVTAQICYLDNLEEFIKQFSSD
jgi:3-deoxy-D-manno-octulosonic acid (KDO) 8-phosphate synthase